MLCCIVGSATGVFFLLVVDGEDGGVRIIGKMATCAGVCVNVSHTTLWYGMVRRSETKAILSVNVIKHITGRLVLEKKIEDRRRLTN